MHLTALPATLVSGAALAAVASSQVIDTVVPCANGAAPVILCYGEHASCTINFAGDQDRFDFFGVAGDEVTIKVVTSTNNLDPVLSMFNATGQIALPPPSACLAPWNNICTFATVVTLPDSGAYAMFVADDNNFDTGDYLIRIEKSLPDYSVPALVYGGLPEVITLAEVGDYDWLRIDGAIGTDIRLSFVGQTNNLDHQASLYDPNGVALQTGGCVAAWNTRCSFVMNVVNLPQDGTYWLRIWDDDGFNTGSLDVSLNCQSPFVMCPTGTVDGPIGTSYCVVNPNSTGGPALLSAFGSPIISDDRVYLTASSVPAGTFGIFFSGMVRGTGPPLPPPSQGLLCVNNPFWRHRVIQTCANGEAHYRLPLNALPAGMTILAGETWNFQLWFRDGTASNTSDGLEIQFL